MMAAQLLGTGGVAILLLVAAATETPPIVDVALLLALFAAFAAVAFVRSAAAGRARSQSNERQMNLAFDISPFPPSRRVRCSFWRGRSVCSASRTR